MTIELRDGVLHCAGTLAVDDAEQLLGQLLEIQSTSGQNGVTADLSACEHIHAACLQVLMAAQVNVVRWPKQPALTAWLQAALDRNPYHSLN